jgi:hypothetical protein
VNGRGGDIRSSDEKVEMDIWAGSLDLQKDDLYAIVYVLPQVFYDIYQTDRWRREKG